MLSSIPGVLSAVMLVTAVALLAPRILDRFGLGRGFVPELLLGVVAVAVVIELHLSAQRKLMREVSSALIAAAYYTERLEQFSLIDPHTELFNRKYLDQLFNQQMRWMNRTGKPSTLLLFDVSADRQRMATEAVVVEAARILRSNFRGSDYILRLAGHQLFVLLPETNEEQAWCALLRLADKVDHWNLENSKSEMMLRHEMNVCFPGGDLSEKLRAMEEKLAAAKARMLE